MVFTHMVIRCMFRWSRPLSARPPPVHLGPLCPMGPLGLLRPWAAWGPPMGPLVAQLSPLGARGCSWGPIGPPKASFLGGLRPPRPSRYKDCRLPPGSLQGPGPGHRSRSPQGLWGCQKLDKNHEIWIVSGSYRSNWAENQPGWFPPCPGCLLYL